MTFLTFIILALAIWRLSSLLVNEGGPFNVLALFRDKARRVTDLFDCIWCVSVWMGIGAALAWTLYPAETVLICLPLALSGLAIGWDRWANG